MIKKRFLGLVLVQHISNYILRSIMKNLLLFFLFSLVISFAEAQEKQPPPSSTNKFKSYVISIKPSPLVMNFNFENICSI